MVFLDVQLSAPELSATVQALKELVERLPQTCDQAADVMDLLGSEDRMVMDTGRPPGAFVAGSVHESGFWPNFYGGTTLSDS
ncbi:hypothetical protein [Streptomyces katrae]|uniref:Uncharacterized protein n=1 Tax=Streptomyces katrae TaxID=68223 RepID=A0A0F4JJX6_9ACTN|nr:hypothetical protein [Streptomyces katrae]KJY34642.1 hypothetical protein VR44_11550 [Streptomyces katrae]